jgi:hypothetical protein
MSPPARRLTKPEREQRTESEITVREVTDYQTTWSERERGTPGAFTIQLILDHGVDEYVIRPTAADTQVLVDLFNGAAKVYFDLDRKVLMFGNKPLGS